MTAAPKAWLVWAAGKDRVGHAFVNGRRLPAACGLRPWDPRWDWPTVRRCAACQVIVEAPIAS